MKHWGWMAIMLLGIASVAGGCSRSKSGGAAEVDRLNEDLREKELPVNEPIDFTSLRKRADAMAARQHSSFKLHQVEIEFEFPSSPPRIDHVDFHYFRPAPSSRWEELEVGVNTPHQFLNGRWSPGRISGGRNMSDDPRPNPAPANIIAPEEALRRLNRGAMSPGGDKLAVQLFLIGAKYWRGTVARAPSYFINTGHSGRYYEEPFFVKTAPSGKWVWWTVTQYRVAGKRYEYIYMDAITGKATSHCAEQPSSSAPLVPVPCAPPG